MKNAERNVQCTRCRNGHLESERIEVQGTGMSHRVCPRCRCKSFYDLTPQAAWCWASGLIEFGSVDAVPEDSIVFAHGPKSYLVGVVSAVARQGKGANAGKLLVPGIPEADDQNAAADALSKWVDWCASNNGRKGRHGVVFRPEVAAATQ